MFMKRSMLASAVCGCLLLLAACALPMPEESPVEVLAPVEQSASQEEPAPLPPGIHLLALPHGRVPVLVAEEETAALTRINLEIATFSADAGWLPLKTYPYLCDGYLQAIVTRGSSEGPVEVASFVYDLEAGDAVRLVEAMAQFEIDVSQLFPRYEAILLEEAGQILTGMSARAFRYLETGDGIDLIFLIQSLENTEEPAPDQLIIYSSAADTFRMFEDQSLLEYLQPLPDRSLIRLGHPHFQSIREMR